MPFGIDQNGVDENQSIGADPPNHSSSCIPPWGLNFLRKVVSGFGVEVVDFCHHS